MATLDVVTLTGRGTVANTLLGGNLANATLNATGSARKGGSLSDAFLAGTGTVGGTVARTGSFSIPLDQAQIGAAGLIVVTGQSAVTLDACLCDGRSGSDAYLTATGVVINNLNGGNLANCQFLAAGQVIVTPSLAITTAAATVSGTGAVLGNITGDLSVTLERATLFGFGYNPDASTSSVGGGGRGRRKSIPVVYEITIDDRKFYVDTQEEAYKLLKQARDAAEEAAKAAAAKALARSARGKAAAAPAVPSISLTRGSDTSEEMQQIQAQVEATQAAVQQAYAMALAQANQIAMDKIAEKDDDEAITALLMG